MQVENCFLFLQLNAQTDILKGANSLLAFQSDLFIYLSCHSHIKKQNFSSHYIMPNHFSSVIIMYIPT